MTPEQVIETFVERIGQAVGSALVDGASQKEIADKLRELAARVDRK